MRTVPAAVQTHLNGESLTVAYCLIATRRDGEVFRFTTHDQDIVLASGEAAGTYAAALAFTISEVGGASDMSVSETEITGILDAASITEEDLLAGLWDYCEFKVFAVNWASPADGIVKLGRGYLGECVPNDTQKFRSEMRGLAQLLQQKTGDVLTPECRADLGDTDCRVPIWPDMIERSQTYYVADGTVRAEPDYVRVAIGVDGDSRDYDDLIWECTGSGTTAGSAPTYSGPAGTVVTDGSAEFTARDAWTVAGRVASSASRGSVVVDAGFLLQARHATGFFDAGAMIVETGANAGARREILSWNASTRTILVVPPFPQDFAAGDVFRLQPGCLKRYVEDCIGKFDNRFNFLGEPHVPGQDALQSVERVG